MYANIKYNNPTAIIINPNQELLPSLNKSLEINIKINGLREIVEYSQILGTTFFLTKYEIVIKNCIRKFMARKISALLVDILSLYNSFQVPNN